MSKKKKSRTVGVSDYLTLIFVALKLAGIGVVATWSWVWVLSPLWIGFILKVIIGTVLSLHEKAVEKEYEPFKGVNDFEDVLNDMKKDFEKRCEED